MGIKTPFDIFRKRWGFYPHMKIRGIFCPMGLIEKPHGICMGFYVGYLFQHKIQWGLNF